MLLLYGNLQGRAAAYMPKTLLDFMGYKFYFWSREDGEPIHVHVSKGKV
jgi:hypothetical protein